MLLEVFQPWYAKGESKNEGIEIRCDSFPTPDIDSNLPRYVKA